jgi:hypothetical protein
LLFIFPLHLTVSFSTQPLTNDLPDFNRDALPAELKWHLAVSFSTQPLTKNLPDLIGMLYQLT